MESQYTSPHHINLSLCSLCSPPFLFLFVFLSFFLIHLFLPIIGEKKLMIEFFIFGSSDFAYIVFCYYYRLLETFKKITRL